MVYCKSNNQSALKRVVDEDSVVVGGRDAMRYDARELGYLPIKHDER